MMMLGRDQSERPAPATQPAVTARPRRDKLAMASAAAGRTVDDEEEEEDEEADEDEEDDQGSSATPAQVDFGAAGTFAIVILSAIGLLLTMLTWSLGSEVFRFRSRARSADGVVVRQQTSISTDRETSRQTTMHAGVVRFEVDGRQYEVVENVGSGSPTYAEGARVRVLYQPDDPRQARLDEPLDLYFMPVLVGVMAAASLGFAALFLFLRLKTRRVESDAR